jgi:hypothetical protein
MLYENRSRKYFPLILFSELKIAYFPPNKFNQHSSMITLFKVYTMERIEHIDSKECKGQKTITIHLKGGNEPRLMLSPQVRFDLFLLNIFAIVINCVNMHVSLLFLSSMNIVSIFSMCLLFSVYC